MLTNLGEDMSDEESKFVFEKNSGEKNYMNFDDFCKIFSKNLITSSITNY